MLHDYTPRPGRGITQPRYLTPAELCGTIMKLIDIQLNICRKINPTGSNQSRTARGLETRTDSRRWASRRWRRNSTTRRWRCTARRPWMKSWRRELSSEWINSFRTLYCWNLSGAILKWRPQNFLIFWPPLSCHCHTHATYQVIVCFWGTPSSPLPMRT